MVAPDLVLTACEGDLLRVTINRPGKHNALSRDTLNAIRAAFEQAAHMEDLRCVVLRGSGDRYFAAGGDLHDLAMVRTVEETQAMAELARAALDAVRACPIPVVAMIDGHALGGGAELAVACDLRVIRAGAQIGFIQGKLAITTGWGGGPDLIALVGSARALRMMARCELVDARTALEWGLVDAIADGGDPEATLDQFIAPLLAQEATTLRAIKAQVRAARRNASYAEQRAIEREAFVTSWTAPAHWKAVERVFANTKRGPA